MCTKIQNTNAWVHGLAIYIDLHSLIYGTFSNLFMLNMASKIEMPLLNRHALHQDT